MLGTLSTNFAAAALVLVGCTANLRSQTCLTPGCLDATFGSEGKAIYQIYNSIPVYPEGMAVQADGKIVAVVGYSVEQLVRLNADGSLDQSFGSGGIVSFSWSVGSTNGNVYAVAIQNVIDPVTNLPEERIVIAGQSPIPSGRGTITGLHVARFMPDGQKDTSFGTGGDAIINAGGAYASAIALQSDGKILTVGVDTGKLVRLNSNGTLDTSFGSGGMVSTYASRALAVDSAGGILVGGSTTIGKGKTARNIFAVRRYTGNGAADNGFGNAGVATADLGVTSQVWNLRIDASGNILVTGTADGAGLARFTSNGLPDVSFGNSGKVRFTGLAGASFGRGLVMQPYDGKIVVTGQSNNDFALARFDYNGSLDAAFGNGGTVVVDVYGADFSATSVLQMDPLCSCPKIVMSGGASPYTSFARFIVQ